MICDCCKKEVDITKEMYCEREGISYHSICYFLKNKNAKKQNFDQVLLSENQSYVRDLLNKFVSDDIKSKILNEYNKKF